MSTHVVQALGAAGRDRGDPGVERRPGVGGAGLGSLDVVIGAHVHDPAPEHQPGPGTTLLRVIRATLTGFLLIAAGVLSFGALRHQALAAGIIHGALLVVSAHTLAGVWALCPDVLAAVGIVGIRIDRRDPRAWVALILGLGMTLSFQVWAHPWPWLLRGVPAAAGAMAVWLLEVPWNRPAWEPIPTPLGHPVPEPNPDQPAEPEAEPEPEPDQDQPDQPRTNGSKLTPDQVDQVRQWFAEGRRVKAQMAKDLGLNNRGRLAVGRLVDQLVAQTNGHGPGGGS